MRISWLWTLVLSAALPLAAQQNADGFLVAKVKPGRAGVFVDGRYLGPAENFRIARTYSVPAGEHEIRFVDPRYQDVVTNVTIEAGKKKELTSSLPPVLLAQPPFGKLRILATDNFAAVFVNGRYCGHADQFSNFAQALLLNPGDYDVKIVPQTGTPITTKVKIDANKTTIVR